MSRQRYRTVRLLSVTARAGGVIAFVQSAAVTFSLTVGALGRLGS